MIEKLSTLKAAKTKIAITFGDQQVVMFMIL